MAVTLCTLELLAMCAEQHITTTPPEESIRCIKLMKSIFAAKVIGLELYSPLFLPDIKADDTKASVMEKLQAVGFKVLEKDGVVNLVDAKERSTGRTLYPFVQRVDIPAGTYGFRDLQASIKKQTGFKIICISYMISFKPKWDILVDFPVREVVPVREIMNCIASKADGWWVIERDSFRTNMSLVAGEYLRTDHPKIGEDDAGDLDLQ